MSCDHPAIFFLQEQHSRYSVTMKYHPLMSKTLRTVLYNPQGLKWLPRRRQLGFVHTSLYAHMRQGNQRNSLLWKNGSGKAGGCEYNNWGPGGDHHSCRGSVSVNFPDASLVKRALLTQRCCSFGSVCFQPSGSKSCEKRRKEVEHANVFIILQYEGHSCHLTYFFRWIRKLFNCLLSHLWWGLALLLPGGSTRSFLVSNKNKWCTEFFFLQNQRN